MGMHEMYTRKDLFDVLYGDEGVIFCSPCRQTRNVGWSDMVLGCVQGNTSMLDFVKWNSSVIGFVQRGTLATQGYCLPKPGGDLPYKVRDGWVRVEL